MKYKNDRYVMSTMFDNKEPSDILSEKEFIKFLPYLSPEIALNSLTGKYWSAQIINNYGSFYIDEMNKLENDNQRYIVFCWMLGCHLWKSNLFTWEHYVSEQYKRFGEHDWSKANNTILFFAMSGMC